MINQVSLTIRKKVIERSNHKCQICGRKWTKRKYFFNIHHIDNNPKNNDLSNLMLVCFNCHRTKTKIGRPVSSKPRKYRHTFRLNKDEEILLQTKLRALGVKKKSDTLRRWVLYGAKHDC